MTQVSNKKCLYLLIGYPGAGKSTVGRIISQHTGAVHLVADFERHKMFPDPQHTEDESLELYQALNSKTEQLLAEGKSVVFDTNFNFKHDRDHLREIATRNDAETLVIWVQIDKKLAKQRAVGTHETRNGYMTVMSEERFNKIVSKLEPPFDEKFIKIDGTNIDEQELISLIDKSDET